jgi:signal transduction histidine kinase
MTRRVALASIAVVCVVMLLLGGTLYIRFAHDLHASSALIRAPLRRELAQVTNRATLVRLRRELILGSVVGAIVAAVAIVIVTRLALAPVRATADVADRIARTSDLGARVPVAPGGDELARLTSSMNRMLDRVEASDGALRRLVGDASHELRTPITSLRGNLELLSSTAPVSEPDRAAALADARADTHRLGQLVEDLLALARADAAPVLEPLPLVSLLSELPADRVQISPAARIAVVSGDRTALESMIRNLTANADRYAGGWELAANADRTYAEMRVIDHGPGIPPVERERVFERFARGAAAAGTDGSGIGLAIVDAVTRAHDGSVEIEDTPGGGATFVVRLPMIE